MAHKDRKIQTKRGTRSCGWGNTQKHRGAGSRGGRGMAGSNKQKWSYVSKYMPDHFGRSGFKRPLKMLHDDTTINLADLSRMVNDGNITITDKKYIIDLTAMGIDKLLGSGKVTHALEINVAKSSKLAIEKIQSAGGKVVILEEQTIAPVSK